MSKKERLDKIVSNMGFGSRKDVKKLIKDGLVEVDGKIVNKNNIKVNPHESTIVVEGVEINYREYIYLMLNKPAGYISTTDEFMSFTVLELLEYQHLVFEPFPAGRLDKDTEGLLILTNDGKFAHNITSPKKNVDKIYYVEVDGEVDEKTIEKFSQGVRLDDGYLTKPADLEIIEVNEGFSRVLLTISEGKFHQVKRMFKSQNMTVDYLKRIAIGNIYLDENLELGEYRELSQEEIDEFI